MESNSFAARLRVVGPVAVVIVLAVAGVFVAMTILGSSTPGPTASPSASGSATVTASPTPSPSPTPEPTPSPSETATASPMPTPSGRMPEVTNATATARDPKGIWTVDCIYPQLNAPALPMASTVNLDIAGDVQARMQAFEAGPAAIRVQPGKVNTLDGSYSVEFVRQDLASFTLKWVDDTSGAHPSTTIETLNYDLNTGTRLAFSDIFSDRTGALTVLSQQSRQLLHAVLGGNYDATVVNAGTSPDCPSFEGPTPSCPLAAGTNFDTWALKANGLEVIFQEYQVASYADGSPSVVVPWSALGTVLKPGGPGASLAGS